jgi:hypothetical protein
LFAGNLQERNDMDLEKLGSRAKSTLLIVSFMGLLLTAVVVILTLLVVSHAMHPAGSGGPGATVTGEEWITGLSMATGPIVLVAVGLLIACVPWVVLPLTNLVFRRAIDSRYRSEQLLGNLESQRQTLEGIREAASLSDAAKQVAFRAKDLQALRAAIREDMDKGDFESATMLANEMELRFGYGQEADKFRDQINTTSKAAIERRIRETAENVDGLLQKFEWRAALRESGRLKKQFPDNPEVAAIADKIETARDAHKRELLKNWKDAVAKDDVDTSVGLLKQLDQYLTPSEAEAYKEAARDVFRKRLQQLGVQFALHVHDKNWAEALRIGRTITDEFPNTRMAAEVRERMAILQGKAQQPLGV